MTKVVLSDVKCRNFHLPAGRTSADLRDAHAKGLELRATAGRKAWRFRYTRKSDGARRQFTFGHFPEISLADARAKASAFGASVRQGGDPAAGIQERKDAPTFAELVAEWQANHAEANRSLNVRKDGESMLRR